MKPCFKNRKLIAWLALGNLEDGGARALREHLASCEGCRQYLNELSKVAVTLSAAELKADIQATASFHQRVAHAVKSEESHCLHSTWRAFFPETWLNWRVALPVAGGVAVVLGVLLTFQQQPQVPSPAPSGRQSDSKHALGRDVQPTIAYYQMVANQSMEKLDQLLTEEGTKRLPPAPLYTASTFATADAQEPE